MKNNFIAIRHTILETITETEIEKVINKNYDNIGKIIHVDVNPFNTIIPHEEIININWRRGAFQQGEIFKNQIKPLIEKEQNQDFELLYFGAAPIPLAIHLGSKFGTWKRVNIFLRNHQGSKEWYKKIEGNEFEIFSSGSPNEEFTANGDVLIRIASSYKIDKQETNLAIETELIKEIDISAQPLVKDLPSSENAVRIADSFEDSFDKVINNLKNIDTIHIIASVPVGLAFLLGTKMSANVSPNIQTYQYFRTADIKYDAVLKINANLNLAVPLSEEENQYVNELKEEFSEKIWEELQSLIENEENANLNNPKWYDYILNEDRERKVLDLNRWNQMDAISETPLKNTSFGNQNEVSGGFRFDEINQKWEIDNRLILGISKKVNGEKSEIFRALRMLLLHEGVHYWLHGLNDATAQGIGRFPKILEEIDYQADVWAMLYEYSFAKIFLRKDLKGIELNQFFAKVIQVAIATMWSFDDEGVKLSEIQIRRLNRYLIWYWQLIQLENAKVKSLQSVVDVLSNPPLIELKGLLTKAEGERVFYRLKNFQKDNLEIGVLWKNKILRNGNIGSFRIEELIEGFRNRDSVKIKEIVRSLYFQVSIV